MNKSKNEEQRIRRNVIREILTYGIVIPYLCCVYFITVSSKAILGNYFVLDVMVVVFMGVCLFFRYLKRDKEESTFSRVQCLAAAAWAMLYIAGFYLFLFNVGFKFFVNNLQTQTNNIVPIIAMIGVKIFAIYKTYSLIEPFGTQLVSSSYEDYDFDYDDEDDEDDDTVVNA